MKNRLAKSGSEEFVPTLFLGMRVSALWEIGLFLGGAWLIDQIFLDGTCYWHTAPHPFWFIIILISIQYGTREGLLSALLAGAVLLAGNLPQQSLSQDWYDYLLSIVGNPLIWFLTALVLGELRMRQMRERDRLRRELSSAVQREESIRISHDTVYAAKDKLEARVASQMRSVMTTYEAARSIEKLEPAEVLSGIMEVFAAVLNPKRFSLFLLENNTLEVSKHRGWEEGDSFSRSFSSESPMFREVLGRRRTLCCVNEEDEQTLQGEGMLAGPLVCALSGEVMGMLKIESLEFLDLNVSNVESFKVLCEWVGTTYANALRFQTARSESCINSETQLYSYDFFQRQTNFITVLAQRFGFDLSLLILRLENGTDLDPQRCERIPALLAQRVRKEMRRTDLVFDYQRSSEFAFVLPGNSVAKTQVLVDKIISRLGKEIQEARFSATTLALHQVRYSPEMEPFTEEVNRRNDPMLTRILAMKPNFPIAAHGS